MENQLEINRIAYNIIRTQIEFGTYCFGEQLPPIEEMAELLFVSLDTVRHAYHQLKDKGYITLSSRIGTIVSIQYTEKEIEQHIQTFFSERKDTILDICFSMPILMSNIQLISWQNMMPEDAAKLEEYISKRLLSPPYLAMLCLKTIYKSLENDLLSELIHKLYIVYMLPFLDLKDIKKYMSSDYDALPAIVNCYKQKNWPALHAAVHIGMKAHLISIQNFYETRIVVPTPETQITFAWSSYKKASQLCYSVGFEILNMIVKGDYPMGSFLPSLKSLAKEKQVSVSTIRHVLALLNDLGIAKTINGVGTQVLSIEQAAENCNWSSATVQKRLLDHKQSLQLTLLSCQEVVAHTISNIAPESKRQWLEQLYLFESLGKLDWASTFSIEMIAKFSPYQTVRTVYGELHSQLLWGVPLRGLMGAQKALNEFYGPYYRAMVGCLERSDAEGYAIKLQEMLCYGFTAITDLLIDLGIM